MLNLTEFHHEHEKFYFASPPAKATPLAHAVCTRGPLKVAIPTVDFY